MIFYTFPRDLADLLSYLSQSRDGDTEGLVLLANLSLDQRGTAFLEGRLRPEGLQGLGRLAGALRVVGLQDTPRLLLQTDRQDAPLFLRRQARLRSTFLLASLSSTAGTSLCPTSEQRWLEGGTAPI